MTAVGFEPTRIAPPELESGALDRSAKLSDPQRIRWAGLLSRELDFRKIMDPLGFEPRAFCMRSRRDTTTP